MARIVVAGAGAIGASIAYHLALRGVPVREDVRLPLRTLSEGEREELRGWHESS